MTSQLNVDTIVDKLGTSGPSLPNTTTIKMSNTSTYVSEGGAVTQNVTNGLIKGFAYYEQGTNALSNTFNVASATDSATGTVVLNITNNRDSATEPFTGIANGAANTNVITYEGTTTSTTSQVHYNTTLSGSGDALADAQCMTVLSGELA